MLGVQREPLGSLCYVGPTPFQINREETVFNGDGTGVGVLS